MKGDSLLFKSFILTVLVFIILVILNNKGLVEPMSFWFFASPLYFFGIAFIYSLFIDRERAVNSKVFFSIYPILIIVKLIFTASFIVLYTEFSLNPKLSFWILTVVLYFLYSTLIAMSLYIKN